MTVRILVGDCRTVLDSLPETLAYCAGVIDSDGYIGVRRSTYAMRKTGDSKQPVYSERVCVKQVEPEAVRLLAATFGGRVTEAKPSARHGRALYSWQITDRKAAAMLAAVLPYLRIKGQQARNCLLLRAVKEESKIARVAVGRGHAGAATRPSHLSAAMESAYQSAKSLNHVGTR